MRSSEGAEREEEKLVSRSSRMVGIGVGNRLSGSRRRIRNGEESKEE